MSISAVCVCRTVEGKEDIFFFGKFFATVILSLSMAGVAFTDYLVKRLLFFFDFRHREE